MAISDRSLWLWRAALLGLPLSLLTSGLVAVRVGSPASFWWGAMAPRLALSASLFGMAAALIRRKRSATRLAAWSVLISVIALFAAWLFLRQP